MLEARGRRMDVILTAAGRALAEASFDSLQTAQAKLLAPLRKTDRKSLASQMDQLLEAFAASD